jgi:hypothetical protein
MRLLRPFLGLLALALLSSAAAAQVTVQPSAQKLDAATTVCPFAATPVAVNQQETVTCTPPAGQFVYITGISFDVCTNGTGTAANQVTFTSTNLTGSPVWSFSIAATASICQHWSEPLATPLKSTAAGLP